VLTLCALFSGAAFADPIMIREGESHDGNLESRNDPITIESGATVNGNVDARNAPIMIGNDVEVGDVETRNGQVSLGDRVVPAISIHATAVSGLGPVPKSAA
jgi:hypothetical protein